MELSLGEEVFIASLGIKGIIVNINDSWYDVRLEDESTIPIHQDEVEPSHKVDVQALYKATMPSNTPTLDISISQVNEQELESKTGIWVQFFPLYVQDKLDAFRIYLSNETKLQFNFSFEISAQNQAIFRLDDMVALVKQKFHIYTYKIEQWRPSRFVLNCWEENNSIHHFSFLIDNKKLFKIMKEVEGLPSFPIFIAKNLDKMPLLAQPIVSSADVSFKRNSLLSPNLQWINSLNPKSKSNGEMIIDLHFEKLGISADVANQWTKHEKKMYQLAYLEQELFHAHHKGVSKVKIIHGIGSGALQQATLKLLQSLSIISKIQNENALNSPDGVTIALL